MQSRLRRRECAESYRQVHGEGASAARFAHQRDAAAMCFGGTANQAQSEARTGDLRLDGCPAAAERLKNLRLIGWIDSRAAILDADSYFLFVDRIFGVHANQWPAPACFKALFRRLSNAIRSSFSSPGTAGRCGLNSISTSNPSRERSSRRASIASSMSV